MIGNAGFIEGLGVREGTSSFINLQYANDTLMFGNCNITLKAILFNFEIWSGLSIDFHKSAVIFFAHKELTAYLVTSILNCPIQDFPIKYLGIPIKLGALRKGDWSSPIDSLEKKLEGWKGKLLSLGGHITLLNSSLFAYSPVFLVVLQNADMGGTENRQN